MFKYMLIATSIWLTSCAYSVHQVHISDFSFKNSNSSKFVEANTEQKVILGITTDSQYINDAYNTLQKQCPHGDIDGITTKYSTDLGFFSWTNRIKMRGICRS